MGTDIHATLREAREARRLGRVGEHDTLLITLPDGRYHLTTPLWLRPEDSGTPTSPTIIRAEHPGRAVLDGGVVLEDWRRPTAAELSSVPLQVHDRIWVCDAPRVAGRIVETRQLWQSEDNQGQTSKRLPQASLVAGDSLLPLLGFDRERRELVVPTEVLPQSPILTDNTQPWLLVHQRWAIALLRIASMRQEEDGTHFSIMEPESQREFEHPWPQPVIADTLPDGKVVSSSFNLLGSLAVLDQPGEWLQTYPDGLIYWVSDQPDGGRPALPITIPVTRQLICIEGTASRPVHDVQVEGLQFVHTAWTTPNREGWVTLQAGMPIIDAYKLYEPGLPHKASLENQAWIGRPEAAISISGAQRVAFKGCTLSHLGACGIDFTQAVSYCSVTDCQLYDVGATGILAGHFACGGYETHVPFMPDHEEALCHHLDICRNTITDIGREDWGACAINIGYAHHATVADCKVKGCPWSGICLGWGWLPAPTDRQGRKHWPLHHNHLLRNQVQDFGQQLHDCGALYTLSYQPHSSIADNDLSQPGRAPFATNDRVFYIYLDEATDGFVIEHNLMPEPRIGYNQPGPHLRIQQ